MKTPEEIVNFIFKQDTINWIDVITEIQDEAWNEAVNSCAEKAWQKMYDIGIYEDVIKESVLKLKR